VLATIPERTSVARVSGFFTQIYAAADTEIRKLRHDPSELLTRALQPAILLLLFGQVMAHVRGLASDGGKYLDFLAPGILAQSVLFAAIFYGIAAIWERDLGVQGGLLCRAWLVAGDNRLCARRPDGHQNRFCGFEHPWRRGLHRPRL